MLVKVQIVFVWFGTIDVLITQTLNNKSL